MTDMEVSEIFDDAFVSVTGRLASLNLDKMDDAALTEMVKRIGKEHMTLLFAIKRADLLAQSSVYHGLLSNIQKQVERVGRLSI